MIWAIIICSIIVLDQVTKSIIISKIEIGQFVVVIDKFFYITHFKNKGAAWSILQNGRFFFIPLTIIVSVVLLYYLYKFENGFLKIALSFIIGGAVGNLIDRIIKGSVTDFLEFHFGSYTFPIFNVADTFIVIGTILLSYFLLFIYKEKN